jgi:hypothetical protein
MKSVDPLASEAAFKALASFRPDPRKPTRYVYKLDGREWTLIRLAILSGYLDKEKMRHRLATWPADKIWKDITGRYEQTADFRLGRPLKPSVDPAPSEVEPRET